MPVFERDDNGQSAKIRLALMAPLIESSAGRSTVTCGSPATKFGDTIVAGANATWVLLKVAPPVDPPAWLENVAVPS